MDCSARPRIGSPTESRAKTTNRALPRISLSGKRPMYRIILNEHEPIIDVHHVEAIEPAIRSSKPGTCHVNEINADPRPNGNNSRRCGIVIK